MKTKNKKRLNLWAVLPIILLSAFVFGIAVYAAYTNQGSVKRVVSTQGMNGTPFSSNYLNLTPHTESSYSIKNITFPENAARVSFEINVCNYVHNNPSKYNENTINYTFSLTLLNADDISLEGLSVTCEGNSYSFNNGVCSIANQTLKGKLKSVNTYKITVPKSFLDTVKIEAVAIPDSASYQFTGNYKLGRRFAFTDKIESTNTWSGSFAETTTEGYDGFNYILSGNGKGNITITWDANLEINNIFLQENGITADGNSITLSINSDEKNRYDIQFYKTENGLYPDIDTVNRYVSISFTETN